MLSMVYVTFLYACSHNNYEMHPHKKKINFKTHEQAINKLDYIELKYIKKEQ